MLRIYSEQDILKRLKEDGVSQTAFFVLTGGDRNDEELYRQVERLQITIGEILSKLQNKKVLRRGDVLGILERGQ